MIGNCCGVVSTSHSRARLSGSNEPTPSDGAIIGGLEVLATEPDWLRRPLDEGPWSPYGRPNASDPTQRPESEGPSASSCWMSELMKAAVASPAETVDASSIRITVSGSAVRQLAPAQPSLMGIIEGDDPHESLGQRRVLTLIVSRAHGVLKADQGRIQSCYGQVDEINDRHAPLSPSAAAPPSYGRASHGRPSCERRCRGFVPSSTLSVRCPVASPELVACGPFNQLPSSQWKSRLMSPRPPSIARYRIHTFADARNGVPDQVISGKRMSRWSWGTITWSATSLR